MAKLIPYCRLMKADAEGRFEFENLGVADYFVGTTIRWGSVGTEGLRSNGGWATESFAISAEGEEVRVIVNGVELAF
jgi:hypothetical protein